MAKAKANSLLKCNVYRNGDSAWNVTTLLKEVQRVKPKPFKVPMAAIDIGRNPWDVVNIAVFVDHVNRALKVDMQHPIILDDTGYVCDGWHRVVKALLSKRKYIWAVRLYSMPKPDYTMEDNE